MSECIKYDSCKMNELQEENRFYKEALEIIAGRKQCLDKLMGSMRIAEIALDYPPQATTQGD